MLTRSNVTICIVNIRIYKGNYGNSAEIFSRIGVISDSNIEK